ncbi:MAG: dephospho-CoA kinase [Muribaculaceae bacterium]|nr:dephospho-CoA kinase [Muribaculaceae bacterium]
MKEARLIGLTGGIGSGKSVVARVLRLKGYRVYDCDMEAKRLMEQSERIVSGLTDRFGKDCFTAEGRLNRPFLAEKIFNNKEDREWLNHLVHSAVRDDLVGWLYGSKGISFVESAILHTSSLDEYCNQVWVVDAPLELRIDRAMMRGGIELNNLLARIESQRGELEEIDGEKIRIINNSGSESLLLQIDLLLDKTE